MTTETSNGRFLSWRWLAGILISILTIAFAAWGAGLSGYIGEVDKSTRTNTANIAVLKEAMNTLKEDNQIIKADIKLILKELRK